MKIFVKPNTVLQGFLVSGENRNQINSPKSNISYSGFEVKYVSDKMAKWIIKKSELLIKIVLGYHSKSEYPSVKGT